MLRAVISALLLSLALAADAPAAAPADPAAASQPAAGSLGLTLAQVDAAWRVRDEPGKLEEARVALEEAARQDPADYRVLWREARHQVWLAEDPAITDEAKSKLGKRAWDLAEKAAAVNPAGVEGWFYAAAGMGNYSLGIGILSALGQGIEGKFKDRLSRAERLDPRFLEGGIAVAWGRFWFKLPWPKHDAGKCRAALTAALAENPENVRARVYLAELEADQGHREAARAAWQAGLDANPEGYDGPEGRRWQAVARAALERSRKK